MQLPGQVEPGKLWPSTVWADITDHYAGLFFRVLGNGSAPFYQIQNENYPKLSAISSYVKQKVLNKESNDTFRPTDRWSKEVFTGYEPTGDSKDDFNQNFLSFKVSSGEVRPRNTAVLIWQRTKWLIIESFFFWIIIE